MSAMLPPRPSTRSRNTPFGRLFNNRWLAPLCFLLVVLGIIAGAIIFSSVKQNQVQLDDGSVWVTSQANGKAARLNVKLKEADAAIPSTDPAFDLAQTEAVTILSEQDQASSINTATVSIQDKTAVSAKHQVFVGGPNVAFLDTSSGNVWIGKAKDIAHINTSQAEPQMRLGQGGKVALTADGTTYGYRPKDVKVLKANAERPDSVEELEPLSQTIPLAADSFTVVDGIPMISKGNRILWHEAQVEVPHATSLLLQAPPTDNAQHGWAAAATENGLAVFSLKDKATPQVTQSGSAANRAQPVSTNDCVHGAWGRQVDNYLKFCSPNGLDAKQGKQPDFLTLHNLSSTSQLAFRTNHRLVVLNDVLNGNVWNPADSTEVIKVQWNKLETENTQQQRNDETSRQNRQHFQKECSPQSGQIKAVDDSFGARAGTDQILDVLRNDQQNDCSVLRISSLDLPAGSSSSVTPVYDGRFLQLSMPADAQGNFNFTYEITDGRGQSSTARVTITAVSQNNRAPQQLDEPEQVDLEQGASYTGNVLGSFTDPDGDPLTLVGARVDNTDEASVATRADGQLTFHAGSMASGRATVIFTVSDGRQQSTGTIYFAIRPANTLAPLVEPLTVQALPDTERSISLKDSIHGTSLKPLELTEVEAPTGTNTTIHSSEMSFSFKAAHPGTYYVPYTVAQARNSANGLVRVEVQAPTKSDSKPVVANDVALLGADNTAIVEPLRNDSDPLGGVLSITEVHAEADSQIKVGMVGNKRVYLTALQIPREPVRIRYTAANVNGATSGSIILQPPALATLNSAPKAENIKLSVRTSGVVSVDVLDHVSYQDGTTVHLQDSLQTDPKTFKGIAFVSSDTLRYQASEETGDFPITYTVVDNLGNSASATVTVSVHESNAENKPAPTPEDAEAQVAAGEKIRIPITLNGIDPDGDDVQLLGLGNEAPELGRITEVGANYLIYEAYPDSKGTDSFSYAVEDWTGQRAQAQVRVGIFTNTNGSSVYARDDEITLRPGTSTSVPVTLNDIASDSGELTVDSHIEKQGVKNAFVGDNMIHCDAPRTASTGYINYRVRNKAGLTDTATLKVTVDPNAPIEPPTAYDYRVPASATIDKKSVEVDVSPWIANPSGSAEELTVDVHDSARAHAHVNSGTTITVELTETARSVPYTVTNATHKVSSTAFIHVPAYGVFPPALRPKAPELRVNAGESLTIKVADYVRVGAGKNPYIDTRQPVSATKNANTELVKDPETLVFTAAEDYGGPASITFTAADARNDGKDKVRFVNSAVLTLPITVIGHEMAPPTFSAPTVDVVAGEAPITLDLKALTHTAQTSQMADVSYSGGGTAGHVTSSLGADGSLSLSASADAAVGQVETIPVTIHYPGGQVTAGVNVRVVASTKPLARVNGAEIKIKAGDSQSVNMLSDAYNPFPSEALTITGAVVDDASKLQVSHSPDGRVTISASRDIGASTNKVLVYVEDATKSKARQVSATITVSVMDRPSAPQVFPIEGARQDGSVNIQWVASNPNGSPIQEYKVRWNGGEHSCGIATSCQITGLTNGTTYSFTVSARNEVGWSPDSKPVQGTPDKVPEAPRNVKVSGGFRQLQVNWEAPQYEGSAPESYLVAVSGGGWSKSESVSGTSTTFNVPDSAIQDGTSFSATVKAVNSVGEGKQSGAASTVDVYGEPDDIGLELSSDNNGHVSGKVSLGNMRNASCSSIHLSRGGQLDCHNGATFAFDAEHDEYFKEISVTATLVTARGGFSTKSATASTVVSYQIGSLEAKVSDNGSDNCIYSWKSNGVVDSVLVKLGDGTEKQMGAHESFTKEIAPWASCPSYELTPYLNNTPGQKTTGTHPYVYKKAPEMDRGKVHIRWDERERNKVKVTLDSGAITAYGKDYSSKLRLGDQEFTVTDFNDPLEVKADAPDTLYWKWSIAVEGVESSEITGNVEGTRVPEPQPEPSTAPSPDPSAKNNPQSAGRTRLRTLHFKLFTSSRGGAVAWLNGTAPLLRKNTLTTTKPYEEMT